MDDAHGWYDQGTDVPNYARTVGLGDCSDQTDAPSTGDAQPDYFEPTPLLLMPA